MEAHLLSIGRVSNQSLKLHLRAVRPFGCLAAFLLATGIGFVVFIGTLMGDCNPGPGCHDHDGLHILIGFGGAVIIAALIGIAGWLVSGLLRMVLWPLVGTVATSVLLVAVTLLIVLLSFLPAVELLVNIT